VGARVGQGGVRQGDGVAIAGRLGGAQLRLRLLQAGVADQHEIGHRGVALGHRLRHVGDAPVARHAHFARVLV
jgi:thiamine monophosphate kinase